MIDQIPIDKHQFFNYSVQPVTEYCITQTAKRFNLPDVVLKAILAVESGKVGELRINKNGTYDVGPMQVNSSWLPKFKGYITKEQILYNGCTNLQVGAWILKYNISQANNDIWQGIGNYHSKTKDKHEKYKQKVYLAMKSIDESSNAIS